MIGRQLVVDWWLEPPPVVRSPPLVALLLCDTTTALLLFLPQPPSNHCVLLMAGQHCVHARVSPTLKQQAAQGGGGRGEGRHSNGDSQAGASRQEVDGGISGVEYQVWKWTVEFQVWILHV